MSAMDCDIFNELRLNGKLCDVIIKVDGQEFKAHKNIMCSCSSYFRALFAGAWSNAEKRIYNIPGVSPEMMNVIIEYAYTRTVSVTADNVVQLLATAVHFSVTGIVKACCNFLESQLCSENCIGIWKLVDCYYCPELKYKVQLFILHHFEEMVKLSEEFLLLPASKFGDIIEKDELNVKQENVVFEAIIKWVACDPHERRKFIPLLLSKVRLALLDAAYFMSNVKNNDYVKGNDECESIIINAEQVMYDLSIRGSYYQDFSNPLTRPRLPYTIIFAFGGSSESRAVSFIESYDARANRWMDVSCEGEHPCAYHGAVYLKGCMYIIGGYDGLEYFSTVRCFDPVKKAWHQVAPMHSRRCYVSVTVQNNLIYAIGGFDGSTRLSTAERYDPETNQWTLISSMHEQRSDAGATTLHGKVYVCGGFTGIECLFTAETYNSETNQWTLIAPMRSRRSGLGVTVYGKYVYAVGGFDGINRLHSVEAYDPLTNTWHSTSNMLTPRSNFGIEVVDDLLFVVGGFSGLRTTYRVECYNEKTDEWHEAHNMNINRSALSCCAISGLPNVTEYAVPRDSNEI
ncbi:kelch-like protein 10 [Protopterus annectens]|uniref:kelch-like protein 10 n=1 Tax=Protopterus annectens TaxID=7888 RepID=UPI001CFC3798|nr:kelch-like protein 10 [Protopterus annectens]